MHRRKKVNETVALSVDGIEIIASKGKNLLEVSLENGIYIPHLCFHEDLESVGVCRLCVVEVEGMRMTVACRTMVSEGMKARTDSPLLRKVRKTAMRLLLANHHRDCSTCAKNGSCELQKVAEYVGITPEDLEDIRPPERSSLKDTSNPFFERDMDKCILCGICVRTCEEILGVSAIDFVNRGYDTTIGVFGNKGILESNCVSCGECVVRCPVGALVPKKQEKPSREVRTVCTYCGCGCGIVMGARGDRIVSARGEKDNPASKGNLCVKGRYGYGFVNSPERLKKPLIKKDGVFKEVEWDEALDLVAVQLDHNRGDSTAVLASAKCTNEENYIIQKFTRAVVGTNNIDHCARL